MTYLRRTPEQEIEKVAKTRIFRKSPDILASIRWFNTVWGSERSYRLHDFNSINNELNIEMGSNVVILLG